jgi:hypothetical protein
VQQAAFELSGSQPLLKQIRQASGQTLPAIGRDGDGNIRGRSGTDPECPVSRSEVSRDKPVRAAVRLGTDGVRPITGERPAAVGLSAKNLGTSHDGLVACGWLLLFHWAYGASQSRPVRVNCLAMLFRFVLSVLRQAIGSSNLQETCRSVSSREVNTPERLKPIYLLAQCAWRVFLLVADWSDGDRSGPKKSRTSCPGYPDQRRNSTAAPLPDHLGDNTSGDSVHTLEHGNGELGQ